MTARSTRPLLDFFRRDPDAERALRVDLYGPGALLTVLAVVPSLEAALRGQPIVAAGIAASGLVAALGTWRLGRLWRTRPLRATLVLALASSGASVLLALSDAGAAQAILPMLAAWAAAQAWLGVVRAKSGVRDAPPAPASRYRELGARAACVALGGWLVLLVAAGVWAPAQPQSASTEDGAARFDAPRDPLAPPFEEHDR